MPRILGPLRGRASLGICRPDSRAPTPCTPCLARLRRKGREATLGSSVIVGSGAAHAFWEQISRFRVPAVARALSAWWVTLQRGRHWAAAPDAAVAMATSASAIGPARPHYVAPGARGSLCAGPSSGCCESKAGADTPPALPSPRRPATPDVREGKSPRWSQVAARPTPPRPTWRPW